MTVVKLLAVLFVVMRLCAGKLAESVQHDSVGSSECKILGVYMILGFVLQVPKLNWSVIPSEFGFL